MDRAAREREAARITYFRKLAGISQAELARRLGVRAPTVHEWVTAQSSPSPYAREKLPGALEVSARVFWGWKPPEGDPTPDPAEAG